MAEKDIDRLSGISTTGHEWDGLKELNNPLPKWWLWTWYACIAWALVYYVLYPSWPLASSYTKGLLGYSQRQDALDKVAEGQAARAVIGKGLATAELSAIAADPKMREFAMANGKAAFGDNCAPCHGSAGVGGPGFPSLQDDDWLWGGKLSDIHQTLKVGIRSTHDETRQTQMPAFGKDGVLKKDEISTVADYVLSLSGKGTATPAGKQLFADNCASCHGEDGKGNIEMGAPNLTDAIWLYGGTKEKIVETVTNSRAGVMPTWEGRLDPVTIKSLAVYVHSLGGGKPD
ncbi:cytochrome-c oxidase, cbb3-type subunit III [Prosthecomicrobium hirschii]|uniref:cytochrome-c oxidase, cbb3-type subunit III n=1 Tax=Prosthecodimorpha hirschii TaxID=665126 RepID=UPI00222043EE|nr:cytochrome-c oxidase, cbb3-type subunit III [Prosthecomicrobium hirschii]MCW1843137.1 cytochrome-c oxidase, cbb3-type subunit III [Prosthecomicrobium hirschii]